MNLYLILAQHGFIGPFTPAPAQPGTVHDGHSRPIPFMILPGILGPEARRVFSERVAEMLTEQWQCHEAGRSEAA